MVSLINQKRKVVEDGNVFKLSQRFELLRAWTIKAEHKVIPSIVSIGVEIVVLVNQNHIITLKLSF